VRAKPGYPEELLYRTVLAMHPSQWLKSRKASHPSLYNINKRHTGQDYVLRSTLQGLPKSSSTDSNHLQPAMPVSDFSSVLTQEYKSSHLQLAMPVSDFSSVIEK